MVNYTLLYKDEKTQVSYFYNLDDHAVYTDKKPINNKRITKLSFTGAIVAVLLYPTIYFVKTWRMAMPGVAGVIIALIGILFGWVISLFIIKYSEVFFVEENKQEMTSEEIKKMYIVGEDFRKKYRSLLGGLMIFTIISTVILCNVAINTFFFIALIGLWAITGMMCFVNRPVCSRKIKKIMK